MILPNYFLADLPANAELTPALIKEACQTLKRNRERYLANRSSESMIKLLSRVAAEWLQDESPFRKLALEQGPSETGFSRGTLESGLDAFFKQITPENLESLLAQEFGHARRLDEFTSAGMEPRRAALVTSPELLAHVPDGSLPIPSLFSLVFGVLLRSAQFVKCVTGAAFLPRLFAHSLYEADGKLGACLELAEWRSQPENAGPENGNPSRIRVVPRSSPSVKNVELLKALFEEADCVIANGTDEALAALERIVPASARFVGYGNRVSFGYVAEGSLSGGNARRVAEAAAADVAAWDQLGSLSPHLIYVENGGIMSPVQFSELLAEELERREKTQPRGELPPEVSAAIASRRSFYEIRATHSDETRLWQSPKSTAWTVVYEAEPRFQLSCLNRFVYVKGVKDLTEALQSADSVKGNVSSVGLAASPERAPTLANQLARWGASRICPLGQMQNPPLAWRRDGRSPLGELVLWTDFEHP
ncbi:MAG TPA: acyl-CoA reductase [Candidatus Dormibacteraeota bacterium]|nr:acyl-CoA reductase [Candidatus Dormibacteraeota bacterium]